MSHDEPPQPQSPPSTPPPPTYMPPAPPVPQPRQRRRWVLPTVTGIAGLLIGTGIGGASSNSSGAGGHPLSAAATSTTTVTEPAAADASSSSSSSAPDPSFTPKPSDFTVTVIVHSKHCFGSAGCNVTYGVKLGYKGAQPLPDGSAYTVTYVITGGDSGPTTDTITTEGSNYGSPDDNELSTASSGVKLAGKVVSVDTA